MEEYFQISDRTRTLEHQYTDLLARKLRLETLLVEEDYNGLVASYEALASTPRDDGLGEQIEELRAEVERLVDDKAGLESRLKGLEEEKKGLEGVVESLSRRIEESEQSAPTGRSKRKGVRATEKDSLAEDEEARRMEEMYVTVKSVERELRSGLGRLQEECMRYKGDVERMSVEMAELRARNAESARAIEEMDRSKAELEEEMKGIVKENSRLAKENVCLDELRRSLGEKDEIISALKENMRQKSEMIEMQKRLGENASRKAKVVMSEDVCNVFDDEMLKAEDSGNGLDLDEYGGARTEERLWDDIPIKPRSVGRKTTGTAGVRRKTGVDKGEKVPKRGPKTVAAGTNRNKENIGNEAGGKSSAGSTTSRVAEPPRIFALGGLLKPENSSYFADLTFNNSSPVIKKDQLDLPKKK